MKITDNFNRQNEEEKVVKDKKRMKIYPTLW
jgi:hypothetical protein